MVRVVFAVASSTTKTRAGSVVALSCCHNASNSNAKFSSSRLCCHRFCGLKGHEMFCEVERSYIEDGFNLYGLRTCVSNFSDCLDLILDRIGPDDSDDSHLTQSACTLYGLIHARYIITAHGLDAMYNKVSWVYCAGLVAAEISLRLVPHFSSSPYPSNSMPRKNLGRVLWCSVPDNLFYRLD